MTASLDDPIEPSPVTLASAHDSYIEVEDSKYGKIEIQQFPADGGIRVVITNEGTAAWIDLRAEDWQELLDNANAARVALLTAKFATQ